MVTLTTKKRNALRLMGILAAVVATAAAGWFGYWHIVDSRNPYGGHSSYGMRDYTPEKQQQRAEGIVAALNTRNPDNVEVFRIDGQPESDFYLRSITQNITAVLPPPGCQYVLDSVEDKGEQKNPAELVPWYGAAVDHAWGFEMKLRQICPGQPPTPRTIRVIAIPSRMGGYWAEAALYERK